MSYSRKPFEETWPGKVVAWLKTQPAGLQVMTADLALTVGFDGKLETFSSCLRKSSCGLLRSVAGPRKGTPTYWSLAEHEPLPVGEAEIDDEAIEWLPQRTSFPDILPHLGPWLPGLYANEAEVVA